MSLTLDFTGVAPFWGFMDAVVPLVLVNELRKNTIDLLQDSCIINFDVIAMEKQVFSIAKNK